MCGIIGVVTKEKRELSPLLIGALSRLEYRGYDSAGIAISHNGGLEVLKCVGAPSEHLHAKDMQEDGKERQVRIGIGHNRWATHGKPTILNAHPHTDAKKRIAVVHNGTILNYETLRKELEDKGVVFASETDTEVIPQLIAWYVEEGETTENAFLKTIERLEGAFGIVAFDVRDDQTLYVAKEGSPIVVGIGQDAYYVASSLHGFIPFTERYLTLLDGEMAVIQGGDGGGLHISTIKEKKQIKKREEEKVDKEVATDLSKGEFDTFMLKEIYEQPTTTQATIAGRIDEEHGVAVLGGLFDFQGTLEKAEHILITGCGTAYNAGEIGAYILEQLTSISVRTEIASEGRYKNLHTKKNKTVVFAVSQSGETADTLEYIKELKRKQYEVFGVVNVVGSALALLAGKGVYTKAGTEVGVASTKAFTAQLAVMYLISLYIARMQTLEEHKGIHFAQALARIPRQMKETLHVDSEIQELVSKYSSFRKIQFLGRGIHVPVAKEAALKFKEITYIESGAYPLGELKHGPIAIIDNETVSVVILPKDTLFEQGVNSIEQIKSKGGRVILITDSEAKGHPIIHKVDDVIYIPHVEDPLLYPFLEIIPLQLFAYYFGVALGRNIDKPRNLAKSVTVQ